MTELRTLPVILHPKRCVHLSSPLIGTRQRRCGLGQFGGLVTHQSECQTCTHHTTIRPAKQGVKNPLASGCVYRSLEPCGEIACGTCNPDHNLRLKVYKCGLYGECTLAKPQTGMGCCDGCSSRMVPPDLSRIPLNVVFDNAKPPVQETGVVIGTYGFPQLARLQIRSLLETSGPTPVLLSDDGSGQDAEFHRIAAEHPHVTFWPSADRRGHYAGDLSVFWKGLQWAYRHGFKYLAKLSQRFIWTKEDWLKHAVERLDHSRLAVHMQRCIDNGGNNGRRKINLYIRSESVVLDVAKWFPHYRMFDQSALNNPTELFLWAVVHKHFAGMFSEWQEMPADRYAVTPNTLWHGSHGREAYVKYAEARGIRLEDNFTVKGWQHVEGWKRG